MPSLTTYRQTSHNKITENTYARYLLVKSFHISRLPLVFFVGELCHDYIFWVQS